jgi:hypothetical protein
MKEFIMARVVRSLPQPLNLTHKWWLQRSPGIRAGGLRTAMSPWQARVRSLSTAPVADGSSLSFTRRWHRRGWFIGATILPAVIAAGAVAAEDHEEGAAGWLGEVLYLLVQGGIRCWRVATCFAVVGMDYKLHNWSGGDLSPVHLRVRLRFQGLSEGALGWGLTVIGFSLLCG